MQRQRRDLALQLRPAHLDERALLAPADDRGQSRISRGLGMPKNLPRIIYRSTRKPHRARHFPRGQHGLEWSRRLQVEIIPDAAPERVEVADGPLPQRFIIGEIEVATFGKPAAIERDLRDEGRRHWCSILRWSLPDKTWSGPQCPSSRSAIKTQRSSPGSTGRPSIPERQWPNMSALEYWIVRFRGR